MPVYELQSTEAALSVNLLKIKEGQKPQRLKISSRRSPHDPFGYSVTFSPDRATQTNDLRQPEPGAVFLFCSISTVETSLWGCGPSDRTLWLAAEVHCARGDRRMGEGVRVWTIYCAGPR